MIFIQRENVVRNSTSYYHYYKFLHASVTINNYYIYCCEVTIIGDFWKNLTLSAKWLVNEVLISNSSANFCEHIYSSYSSCDSIL